MSPSDIEVGELYFTFNTLQDLVKPEIFKIWDIYLLSGQIWYVFDFHEWELKEARENGRNENTFNFSLKKSPRVPNTHEEHPDSADGKAKIKRRVRKFGVVGASVGMLVLLTEFAEELKRRKIQMDNVSWSWIFFASYLAYMCIMDFRRPLLLALACK